MEQAYQGWQYINTLLDLMYRQAEEHRKNHIIAPRYIFRGVTQRFFTSSEIIHSHLLDNKDEYIKQINRICKIEKQSDLTSKPQDEISHTDWVKLEKSFYKQSRSQIHQNITKWIKDEHHKPFELLSAIMDDANYKYVKPQYIRSGAAVRLFHQQNRTQYDYVSYLRNLIAETKSRFPVEYAKYSDLEILADIQHKGGASCLVDFSANFLVSLWFATQDYAKPEPEIGYLFCYDVNTDAIEEDNLTVLNKDKENRCIEELIFETSKSTKFNGKEAYKFWLWKPSNINSRISRQDSLFVFGIEKFKIAEHPVIVLPIPHEWKKSIQHVLKEWFGLYGETIYADASGLSSTNTKIDPLKTQTEYFSESYLYDSEYKDGILEDFELFQKGTSALLKAQYDIALNYFSSFEGTNLFKIKGIDQHQSACPEFYNIRMLLVELNYSKGMCLRHLGKPIEALTHYKEALERNMEILRHCGFDFTSYDQDQIRDKESALMRYATNKLFKILEDYTALLYDTKHFYDAYSQLEDVLRLINESEEIIPPGMEVLIKTACNEIKILADLYNNPRLSDVDLVDTARFETERSTNFCKVLNLYFEIINKILINKIDLYKIQDSNEITRLKNAIKNAIETQGIHAKLSVFTAILKI